MANMSKIAGSNIYSSTYSGIESNRSKQVRGDTLSAMNQEELEMRKAGKTPSKEFLEEKRRLIRSNRNHSKREVMPHSGSEQDRYLQNLEDLNKQNRLAGLPTIRTEIKYASPEPSAAQKSFEEECKRTKLAAQRR